MPEKRKVLRFTRDKFLEARQEEKKPKDDEEAGNSRFLAMISLASELGFSISLPIAGGAFLGHFLDSKLSTTPRMTLSFIFFGLVIAFANIYFIMKESDKNG